MDGLHFACQPGCTACCEVSGFVYITEDDLRRAAAFLDMPPEDFERKYVVRTPQRLRLKKPRQRQCPFLQENGCSIHPAKPTQCRIFPFWPELVEDRAQWSEAGMRCPGIGRGPLVQIGSAMEAANEMRSAYPYFYDPPDPPPA